MRLREEDKERLIKYLDFLESELEDYQVFATLDWNTYRESKEKRRNVERWIENIVNSSIDVAKILLASKEASIPETYKDILFYLGTIEGFDEDFGKAIAKWAKLRNIIVHEYLDIRWNNIKEFIKESEPIYRQLIQKVGNILQMLN
ncbi:MAG: HepT-like ribonuclease domain-containing protein [Candidatus Edwardsbacteria bacterium]